MTGKKSRPENVKTNEFHMALELGYHKEDKQTCLSVLLMYYRSIGTRSRITEYGSEHRDPERGDQNVRGFPKSRTKKEPNPKWF
jgi:hypothetical protein